MNERVSPFETDLDLSDFQPVPAKPPQSQDRKSLNQVVDQVAAANNFTSRQPPKAVPAPTSEPLPSRRRITGRSEQINIKTTLKAKRRLMELSVEKDMPLGEILELALEALEKSWADGSQ